MPLAGDVRPESRGKPAACNLNGCGGLNQCLGPVPPLHGELPRRLSLPSGGRVRFTRRLNLRTFRQAFARPGIWVFVLLGAAAFAELLSAYVRVYTPEYGITKFLVVGHEFDRRGLAVFRSTPKYMIPHDRWGFDGQFYAELALDPLLRDPQLKIALDDPSYRSRRILTSWLAWAGGLGRPFWILNVYAALNLVFWIGFVVLLTRLFRPYGWAGVAGFAAMLLTCGIIESVRSSLTDFPGYVLMTLSMMIGGAGGAGVLALSSLAREPNILAVVGLWKYRPPWFAAIKRNALLAAIAGLPLALWVAYVIWRFPIKHSITGHNLTWPLWGIMGKLGEFSVHATNGDIDWRHWYSEIYTSEDLHALLTIISILTQSIYLYTHREWENRFWRIGAAFVPFFLCISSISWERHFTITRHALPITLAFNLVLAMRPRRGWVVWFVLGNCFVPYGIHLFSSYGHGAAGAPVEYRVASAEPSASAPKVQFAQGWSAEEWTGSHTWRWSIERHATITIVNPAHQTLSADVSFLTRSICPRDLEVTVRGVRLGTLQLRRHDQPFQSGRFLLPSGQTAIEFESSIPAVPSGNPHDRRYLSYRVKDLRIAVFPLGS